MGSLLEVDLTLTGSVYRDRVAIVLATVGAFTDRAPYPVDEPDGCDVFVHDGDLVLMGGAQNILSLLPKTKPPGYTSYLWGKAVNAPGSQFGVHK
jgi:hypothetical protein